MVVSDADFHLCVAKTALTIGEIDEFEDDLHHNTHQYDHFCKNVYKGCSFHYEQSLFRTFVDLSLKTAYNNDENLRGWFRSFAALSSSKDMLWGLQCLIRTPLDYPCIKGFLDYYHSQSISIRYYSNYYHNITLRTINYLKGQCSRMKKHVNSSHPNNYIVIDLLQKEQSLASTTRVRDNMTEAPTRKCHHNR
ncbi:unnamed protein product [Didymodactylos carnosus]|uniref:Uncharacterized protein n=1 Tax=Didymodactylos carnosus TaxID=1234261 RepID=A0A814CJ39_9BILA|nr:unnamed protein product [Didymodactylos carnosus]CAF3718016.1 unnamed protein product [Didymodactylos carnosus]